jgi:diguanylate cyclase (GGDEF)-like protein/PAS domain S-box-containing protein
MKSVQNNTISKELSDPKTYKSLVENLVDHAIFMMDINGHIQTWNIGAEMQLGYTAQEILGKHFSIIFTEEDTNLLVPHGELQIAEKEGRCRDDRKHVRKDGVELWVNGVVTTIRDKNDELIGFSKVLNDISARVAAEDTIRHQAMHDMLTGLPNRKLMFDYLNTSLAEATSEAYTVAVLFIDMDKFKDINDTYGHEVGDILLETVALRLAGTVRCEDMVARFGGDEFIIILRGAEEAEALAERIAIALQPVFNINGINLHITMSIGIAVYPSDEANGVSLIKSADKALYQVKKRGGNGYAFYRPPTC